MECLICCDESADVAVVDCQHSLQFCAKCVVRLRLNAPKAEDEKIDSILVKKKKPKENKFLICPFCKLRWKRVFIRTLEGPLAESVKKSSGEAAASYDKFFLDSEIWIYFERQTTLEKYQNLRRIRCQICKTPSFLSLAAYDEHLQQHHNRQLCSACSVSLWVWPDERVFFTKEALLSHFSLGTPPIPPHPFCQYCNIPFFSDDELYVHEMTTHQECRLCAKTGMLRSSCMYLDDTALLEHLRKNHLICEFPECQLRLRAFDADLDLQAHYLKEHKEELSVLETRNLSRVPTRAAPSARVRPRVAVPSLAAAPVVIHAPSPTTPVAVTPSAPVRRKPLPSSSPTTAVTPSKLFVSHNQVTTLQELAVISAIYFDEFVHLTPELHSALSEAMDHSRLDDLKADPRPLEVELKGLKAQDDPSLLFTVHLSFPSTYPTSPLQASVRGEAFSKTQTEALASQLAIYMKEVSGHQRECAHEIVEWLLQNIGEITGTTTEMKRGESLGSADVSETAVVAWVLKRERAPLSLPSLEGLVGCHLFLGNPTVLLLSGSATALSGTLSLLQALDPGPSLVERFKCQAGLELRMGVSVTPPRGSSIPASLASSLPPSSFITTSSSSSSSSVSNSYSSSAPPSLSSLPFIPGSLSTKVLLEVLSRLRIDLRLGDLLPKEYFRVYVIRLVTGAGRHCGTTGQVSVQLTGEWGCTEEACFPPGAMKPGTDLSMSFTLLDVGEVDFAVLRNMDTSPWGCSMVQISTPSESSPAATKKPEYTCHIHREWIKLGHSKIAYFS